MGTFWQGVSSRLRERLDQVAFETWISPLSFVGIEGHTATLQHPTNSFALGSMTATLTTSVNVSRPKPGQTLKSRW
jgi:hypothetical protein